jgi:hypothetical protein
VLLVGRAQDFAFVWTGGAHQPFIVHAGDDVLHLAVAIFVPHLGIEWLQARRENDRPDIYFQLLWRLVEIDRVILAYGRANAAFLFFEINTRFVYVRDQWNGLLEVDMYGFVRRYFLIEAVRIGDGTIFYAGRTRGAFILANIPGLSNQRDLKVARLALDAINFRIG